MIAPTRRWDRAAFDGIGVLCLLLAIHRMVQGLSGAIGFYDEGILLSHTRVLSAGGWPFRDFYTQYPPGIYFLLGAAWKIFGAKLAVGRWLSIVLRLGIAALSGRAGGMLARRRFAVLPSGLTLLWLALLDPVPFAWLAGLLAAMAAAIALARLRYAWAGAALGLLLCFRHDLLVYFCAALLLPTGYWLYRQRLTRGQLIRAGLTLLAAAAPPILILWLPTLIVVKWSLIYHDLYWDQLHYVLPARTSPVPHLSLLSGFLPMTYSAIFAGPVLGGFAALRARRQILDGAVAIVLAALALAVIPQAIGRADWVHAVYAIAPALTLAGALPYGATSWRSWIVGALGIAFAGHALRVEYSAAPAQQAPVDQTQEQLREYVSATLPAGEPVFIGQKSHAQLVVNDVALYFILDRPSATRYLQFDPGIVTRTEVQTEMIAALESRPTRMVILSDAHLELEPYNASSRPGSPRLDEYLAAHYAEVRRFGVYRVLYRK